VDDLETKMSSLTVEFAFEIGNIVYFRSARHDSRNQPTRYLVFERGAFECHGGVQKMYRVDGFPDRWISEPCLTTEEPEYDTTRDRRIWGSIEGKHKSESS
jgi:hypothetical protein